MRLRVRFTGDDLGRVRLAAQADPVWETVLSVHRLRDGQGEVVHGPWRRSLRASRALPESLRTLIPRRGYFPDFLNPAESAWGWRAALEAVRATPRRRLAAELGRLPEGPGRARWLRGLADGEPAALERLTDDLERYHRVAVGGHPVWSAVRTAVDADLAARARQLTLGGVDALLSGLRPALRWDPPVLEADYPVDREVELGGRGLLLIPSYFCWRAPVMLADAALPPVLVYPVAHGPVVSADRAALGRLLGTTRARVLACAAENGATTGELARRVGISLGSASQHARVLRESGLVHSVRRGNEVLHTLTPAGRTLLPAPQAPAAPTTPSGGRGDRSR
ncbi:helix-turn-helix domain-containing protein [Streptomyces sp. 3MP-14]|uniref:Helix-turn-helix domain-containing protein n=1 Tax=Streptomyces mimosae TaxID=2586635 RepID=A0A5N6AME7_9ACTN|nr:MULTISPECIES: helix-turn-helix domain-containing protein [Streptomyces]KAB8169851.1 helix-turn-helix domain-containing protein [Streptomyces mimosae]KAB8178599.1 helix-turn-helix domain-containing protein [Streptomyces sp. 3MP-14]